MFSIEEHSIVVTLSVSFWLTESDSVAQSEQQPGTSLGLPFGPVTSNELEIVSPLLPAPHAPLPLSSSDMYGEGGARLRVHLARAAGVVVSVAALIEAVEQA